MPIETLIIKLGIFVLAMDHNYLAVPRTVYVSLKQNTICCNNR